MRARHDEATSNLDRHNAEAVFPSDNWSRTANARPRSSSSHDEHLAARLDAPGGSMPARWSRGWRRNRLDAT